MPGAWKMHDAWKLDTESGFLCNKQISKIANFKRDYLKAVNNSEFTEKTKNALFFMNFPKIYKLWQFLII
jgi:hypothetical protein